MVYKGVTSTYRYLSGNCAKILREDLHRRKIAATRVPHTLTEEQKWCRYETCIHLERNQTEGENLLHNIITIDETWVRT